MGKPGYTVEEVCERLGVTARTLHYYEEIGLVGEVPRTEGGHRYFDEPLVNRLEYVLKLKELLGISLQEVKAVVELESRLDRIRETYRQDTVSDTDRKRLLDDAVPIFEELIQKMDSRMAKLQTLREGFQQRLIRTNTLRLETEKNDQHETETGSGQHGTNGKS